MARSNVIRRKYKKVVAQKKIATTKKFVTKVAKLAIRRSAETKNYFYNWIPQPLANNTTYAFNMLYDVAQGVEDNKRIGDKIFVNSVSYKINVLLDPGFFASSAIPQINIRLTVVQNKTRQSNGVTGNAPTWGGDNLIKSGYAMNGIIDREKFTVLKDRMYQIHPENNNVSQNWYKGLRVPFKKNISYDSDNGGYLKFKNYYLLMAIYSPVSYAINALKFNMVHNVSYKDL